MKWISLCCFLIILLLGGCGEKAANQPVEEEKIILQKYDYTKEESELINLLTFDSYIVNYHRIPEVKVIYLKSYQLNDGEWELIGGLGDPNLEDEDDLDGRLAV